MNTVDKCAIELLDVYFVKKEGAYYRPNALGYTYNLAEAGVFTFDEAKTHMKAQGVTMAPLSQELKTIDLARGKLLNEMKALDDLERHALGLRVDH